MSLQWFPKCSNSLGWVKIAPNTSPIHKLLSFYGRMYGGNIVTSKRTVATLVRCKHHRGIDSFRIREICMGYDHQFSTKNVRDSSQMIVGTGFIASVCLHEPLLRGRNRNVPSRLLQTWLLKVNFPSQKLWCAAPMLSSIRIGLWAKTQWQFIMLWKPFILTPTLLRSRHHKCQNQECPVESPT